MINRKFYLLVVSIFILCFFGAGAVFFSRGMAKNFVLDNVYFGDDLLGGMDYRMIGDVIGGRYRNLLNSEVVVKLNGVERHVFLSDLGVEFDSRKTVENVYRVSYGDTIFRHLQTRVGGWSGRGVRVKPVFRVDRSKFVGSIKVLYPEIRDVSDAEVLIKDDGEVVVEEHKNGLAVDFDDSYEGLVSSLNDMKIDGLDLNVRLLRVNYTTNEAEKDAEIIRGFLENTVVLRSGEYERSFVFPKDWVKVYKGVITFDKNEIAKYVQENIAKEIDVLKSDLEIISFSDDSVGYAEVVGELMDGRIVNIASTVEKMMDSFGEGRFEVELDLVETNGSIVNRTDFDFGELKLLAQGRSNFKGSTAGRVFNVRRGLEEKMNNIIVAPGATFSFNSFLGGPVTYSAGWKGALAIFDGKDLKPVPGGGLCQVSTTVYRAALKAGFDVVEKRNHSLYVHYYREYGNGLDATVYPGQQDLKFVNNTGKYVFMRAWTEGNDAFVNFYGADDGRKVELIGPIYRGRVPEKYKKQITLGGSQIAWIQKIIWSDGREKEKILKASYQNAIQR